MVTVFWAPNSPKENRISVKRISIASSEVQERFKKRYTVKNEKLEELTLEQM